MSHWKNKAAYFSSADMTGFNQCVKNLGHKIICLIWNFYSLFHLEYCCNLKHCCFSPGEHIFVHLNKKVSLLKMLFLSAIEFLNWVLTQMTSWHATDHKTFSVFGLVVGTLLLKSKLYCHSHHFKGNPGVMVIGSYEISLDGSFHGLVHFQFFSA